MSKDLVKWRQPESVAAKIERWKNNPRVIAPRFAPAPANRPAATHAAVEWAPPDNSPPITTETVIDLPRICAVTKKLWCARYRREPGERFFRYLRSTVAESWQCVTYATLDNWRTLPPDFRTGIELCPHCGASTNDGFTGSVWCGDGCRMWVCFGLTSRDGYFICQCGSRGQLTRDLNQSRNQ